MGQANHWVDTLAKKGARLFRWDKTDPERLWDIQLLDLKFMVRFVKHVWTSLHVGLASARQQRRYVLERHHYGMEFIGAASASD